MIEEEKMRVNFSSLILVFILSMLIEDCGVSSSKASSGFEITVIASKGPVIGGTVTVYSVNQDGSKGGVIGNSSTKSKGSFTVINPAIKHRTYAAA